MLPTLAVCGVAILGFAALVLDVGMMQYYKRKVQIAADQAAVGGAAEITASGTANMQLAVAHDAAANGFTNGVSGVSITANNPPLSGIYSGRAAYVEVSISKQLPLTFMRVIGYSTGTVSARAVAGPLRNNLCVFVMDPAASNAFSVGGSATFNSQCGIMVDSASSTAVSVSGAGCLTAPVIDVTGGGSLSSSCSPSTTAVTGVAPVRDPFRAVPAPTFSGCDYTNFNVNNNATLNPGVYCNGIGVSGASRTITLNPGTYILAGGGLALHGGDSISGTGVTIYNTAASGYSYQPLTFGGNVHVNLSAPTSGPLESILFFTDRSITSTSVNTITGDSTSTFYGTIYMPTVPVLFIGNGTLNAYTILVADTLSFTGNATVNNDYSSLQHGNPIKAGGSLVE